MIRPERLTDSVTLYEGDCLEVLASLESGAVDLVTDPPYGIGEAAGKNKSRSLLAVSRDYGTSTWDNKTADEEVSMGVAASRYAIVFGGNYYSLPPSSCWLVWDKMNGATDFADCELAWTNLPKAVRQIRHCWHGMIRDGNEERFHPTQKPLAVMQWCIRQLPESDRPILDPFAGSGTTAIAAMKEGRSCILIERDPAYCEIIRRRVREADGAGVSSLFREVAQRENLFAEAV